MHLLDWIIVGLYIFSALGIGLYFTKRASRSVSDYFVAGRSLGWFIAGTSIVATTFSSDTPLVVAGISRNTGIHGHWFWLSAAIGQTATVFFFARLWRRTQAITDIEFIAKRYKPSKARSVLRIFKVFTDGVVLNCTVMASVTLAMAKVIKSLLNLPSVVLFRVPFFGSVGWAEVLLLLLGGTAVLYSALSGLYGVVYTDLIQFILAMVGSVGLALIVYIKANTADGMMAKLYNALEFESSFLNFFCNPDSSALMIFTLFVYLSMTWWHRAPGNGYYIQRLLSTRSERDSVLAFLWFNICQYVIRPWPWIILGLLSLYYLPALSDPERSFPEMINLFMPTGLKGVMVASMLAAFMSTIDTHLNWGTSYIVNDFYKPFIDNEKSTRFYIALSRRLMLVLTMIALLITTKLSSILSAYKYLSVMFGGIATVMIARWYWWRVNPYSEISAVITSLIVANFLQIKLQSGPGMDLYAVRLVITVVVVTSVWITVTFLTSSKKPDEHMIRFYSKMKIPGPGWKKLRDTAGVGPYPDELKQSVMGWLSCIVFLYSLMIGIGKLLFHQWIAAFMCMVLAAISGLILKKILSKMRFL